MLDLAPLWLQRAVSPISRAIARHVVGVDRPLCAIAHERGWRVWIAIFGAAHCRESWEEWS